MKVIDVLAANQISEPSPILGNTDNFQSLIRIKNTAKFMSNELLVVSQEFLAEEEKLCQTMPKPNKKKEGGPYSPHDKQIRRNEVYRYHFDYGYSARRIAELMKINRNTINSDIKYWYSKVTKSHDIQSRIWNISNP